MAVDRPFAYTSVQAVRSLGDYTTLSDEYVLTQIRLAAATINRTTGQWFQVIGLALRVSGRGDQILHFPGYGSIIRIEGLTLSPDESPQELDAYFIEDGRRILRLKAMTPGYSWIDTYWDCDRFQQISRFPNRAGSVMVQGYFGYINPSTEVDSSNSVVPSSTVTIAEFRSDTTTVQVNSVRGIRAGGAVVVGSPIQDTLPLYVVSVDQSGNTFTIDAMGDYLPETLAAGALVKAFGAVPPMIRRANSLLAAKYLDDSADASSSGGAISGAAAKKLIMERTEDYHYRLSSPAGGDTTGSDFSTGDEEVDSILVNFVVAPPGVEFV